MEPLDVYIVISMKKKLAKIMLLRKILLVIYLLRLW